MVIPKPLRERYNIRQGSRVKMIATDDGIVIKPGLERPWVGLRGMMKSEWGDKDPHRLIEEAKGSLFKVAEM